eukprot:9797-Heterococcus_DN1.PRE.1
MSAKAPANALPTPAAAPKAGAKTGHGANIEKVVSKVPKATGPSESDKLGEMLAAQEAAKKVKKA